MCITWHSMMECRAMLWWVVGTWNGIVTPSNDDVCVYFSFVWHDTRRQDTHQHLFDTNCSPFVCFVFEKTVTSSKKYVIHVISCFVRYSRWYVAFQWLSIHIVVVTIVITNPLLSYVPINKYIPFFYFITFVLNNFREQTWRCIYILNRAGNAINELHNS